VRKGELSEKRIDQSVSRLLAVRFGLGIFENPYVDPDVAEATVRKASFQQQGLDAQRKSLVLLHNDKSLLPLERGAKVYAEGVNPQLLQARGFTVVQAPGDADVAVLRVTASAPAAGGPGGRGGRSGAGPGSGQPPSADASGAPGPRGPRGAGMGGMSTGGAAIDLTVPADRLAAVRATLQAVPTVVAMYFDRPYVVPELAKESGALVAHFGVSDEALLDVLSGVHAPTGKLPFELPSSMEAVRAQKEDVPRDSAAPLYPFGHGGTYTAASARK
jgi:beta-glucosidase